MSSSSYSRKAAPGSTIAVEVHLKAARTSVHDLVLLLELPLETPASLDVVRRHLENLQPGVLSAACTDETVDRLTDVSVLDVLGVSPVAPAEEDRGVE